MQESELAKLRLARRRVCANLAKLEPMLAGYHARLAEIEARMQEVQPQLWLPPRRYKANGIFARNELPRLTLAILREAGEPLAVSAIVRRLFAAKGVLPDPATFKRTKNRLHNVLLALDKRGVTAKMGKGNGTKRGLA